MKGDAFVIGVGIVLAVLLLVGLGFFFFSRSSSRRMLQPPGRVGGRVVPVGLTAPVVEEGTVLFESSTADPQPEESPEGDKQE